ncbi:TRAK1 [Acanthosepion pharaonis]|uniref:TRAK1 n=1 Tax=Acanthosepion pharaonis TaxID=158019 RepID=A0A812D8W5_ACAPH|nr:TRAK1 [Sepia pharaonis]
MSVKELNFNFAVWNRTSLPYRCLEALVTPEKSCLLSHEFSAAHCVGVLECVPDSVKLASHDQGQVDSLKAGTDVYETNHDKRWMNPRVDASVITDVCNRADLPEVEILSLLEEQIPKYKLRADTITDFRGYDNEDWIQTPLIPLDDDLELTTEQIEETLKYFILCAQRVTQMTRTYNDIEAVTRLLEEKERDLELAARIGQTLLEKNKELSDKTDHLEEQLTVANDKVSQLKHEISMKDELLRFYTQDLENAECDSNSSTPTKPDKEQPKSSSEKGFNLSNINVDSLQKKVRLLEDDNLQLRLETSQLASVTEDYEEKEEKLVQDCLKQLSDVNSQLESFSDELAQKTEESSRQKEEITNLLSQVVELQRKNREISFENLEYHKKLEAAKDSQQKLTKELAEWQDRYDELMELFEEVQDELRTLRRKHKPSASKHYMSSTSLMRGDSLASELETSMRSEIEYPHGYSPAERRIHNWKIFETARAAKKATQKMKERRSSSLLLKVPSGESSTESASTSVRSSLYLSDGESFASDGYNADLESVCGSSNSNQLGRPGIPGSNDLETALRRLLVKRNWGLPDKDGKTVPGSTKHAELLQRSIMEQSFSEGLSTPMFCPTPESMVSSDSIMSGLSVSGSASVHFKIPEKLQIVKPMEGSVTLRHWQQLAQPHIGGIFESRPGVQIKGEKKIDIEEEVYNLSDYEEDDDYQSCPSKRFPESSTIYTYTDSTVMHPSAQHYSLVKEPSDQSNSMPSIPGSGKANTKKTADTTTFSMSLGLAAILNERGLSETWKFGRRRKGNSLSPGGDGATSDDSFSGSGIYTRSGGSSSDVTPTHTIRKKGSIQKDSNANSTGSATPTTDTTPTESPAKTQSVGASFLNTLKSKGFSIYGILSSPSSDNNNQSGDSTAADSLSDSSAVYDSSATSTTVAAAAEGMTTTTSAGAVQENNQNNNTNSDDTSNKVFDESGVLGAITSFRQGGIL